MANDRDPHLFQFLTREEFKACYAVAFLAVTEEFESAYEIDRFSTPGEEGPTSSMEELVKRAIRFLTFRCDAHFAGIEAVDDGRILAAEIIETRNIAYVEMLRMGMIPSPEDAFVVTLEVAGDFAPGLDVEPIREALHFIRAQKEELMAEINPEAALELFRLRRKALDSLKLEVN